MIDLQRGFKRLAEKVGLASLFPSGKPVKDE